MDPKALALDNVDALIAELETQYETDRIMPILNSVPTKGCTNAYTCTGTCPCSAEEEE